MRNTMREPDPLRPVEPIDVFVGDEPEEDPADAFDAAAIWGANGNEIGPSLLQCCRDNPKVSPYIVDASVAAEDFCDGACLDCECDDSNPDDVINGVAHEIGVLHRPIPDQVVPDDHYINGDTAEDEILIADGDLDRVVKIIRSKNIPGKKITKRPSKPKSRNFRRGIVS